MYKVILNFDLFDFASPPHNFSEPYSIKIVLNISGRVEVDIPDLQGNQLKPK